MSKLYEKRIVKVATVGQSKISNGVISGITKDDYIRQSVNNVFFECLEIYRGKTFEDDEQIDEIMKVMLSENEDEAREQWQGLIHNDVKYLPWISTTNGMKKEDFKEHSKAEVIYYSEDIQQFINEFEGVISLGKFNELEGQEICINKDVLSRLSLTLSTVECEIPMPNYVILPQPTYHIVKDYMTIEPNNTEDPEHDYSPVPYHFNGEIDVFDGGCIAGEAVFDSINKAYGRDDIEFVIIRGYGLAIKGMITKFRLIDYIDSLAVSHTNYFRKIGNVYEVVDMYGDWQKIDSNTILFNESMVKLAKYYHRDEKNDSECYGMTEIKKRQKHYSESKYRKVLNTLYITKVNKPDDEVEDYRPSNYQFMSSLALTEKELLKLAASDLKTFKKILQPFEYEHSTKEENSGLKANVDYVNLLFKNMADKNEDYSTDNIIDKIRLLLDIDPNFVTLHTVKNQIIRTVEKRIRQIASGKPTVKSRYLYLAGCPISYVNWMVFRDQKNNGLQEDEFYSYQCEDGAQRVASRNPQAYFGESLKFDFVRSEYLDEWMPHSKEILVMNQTSDVLSKMSSGDLDGDCCSLYDDELITNAVVEPDKYFISKLDGAKKKLEYNNENRFVAIFKSAGNLIGRYAVISSSIHAKARIPFVYDSENDKFLKYVDILPDEIEPEKVYAYIDEQVESSNYIKINLQFPDGYNDKLREYIKNGYKEQFPSSAKLLLSTLLAIDVPKSLMTPDEILNTQLEEAYPKQPYYMQFKKPRYQVCKTAYSKPRRNAMDMVANRIQKDFLNRYIERDRSRWTDKVSLILKHFKNEKYDKDMIDFCVQDLERIYDGYSSERQQIRDMKVKDENKVLVSKPEAKEIKSRLYQELEVEYLIEARTLMNDFGHYTVMQSMTQLDNCTEDFVISLFFPLFDTVAQNNKCIQYDYVETTEPTETSIKFFHKSYDKKFRKGNLRFRILDQEWVDNLIVGQTLQTTELNDHVEPFDDYGKIINGLSEMTITGLDIKAKSVGISINA